MEKRQVTERILEELREQLRLGKGREAQPSVGVMDSQSVKAADTVGADSRGYDAGKKINGRKRFIVTDTLGLLVVVCVMSASWQDRDGAKTTLLSTYLFTPILHVSPTRASPAAWSTGPRGRSTPRSRSSVNPLTSADSSYVRRVGGRTQPRLADRTPASGPRLRTRSRRLRSTDPLGRDQHHGPPTRPRAARHPATPSNPQHARITALSNTEP
ncbi:transposase, partial [Actinoplanes cyaneus]|uniref:transposase n=1 Tax=Actinoplanes cyaneus TaxID=52696 RepID=UPI001EF2B13B